MLKLNINTNLGKFHFRCNFSIFNIRAIVSIFVITGNGTMQDGQQDVQIKESPKLGGI